jgi:hypothetical protein
MKKRKMKRKKKKTCFLKTVLSFSILLISFGVNYGLYKSLEESSFTILLLRKSRAPGTTWSTNVVQFRGFPFDLADSSRISAGCGGAF